MITLHLDRVFLVMPLLDGKVNFLVHPLESHIHLIRRVEQHLNLIFHTNTHGRRLGAALEILLSRIGWLH